MNLSDAAIAVSPMGRREAGAFGEDTRKIGVISKTRLISHLSYVQFLHSGIGKDLFGLVAPAAPR